MIFIGTWKSEICEKIYDGQESSTLHDSKVAVLFKDIKFYSDTALKFILRTIGTIVVNFKLMLHKEMLLVHLLFILEVKSRFVYPAV